MSLNLGDLSRTKNHEINDDWPVLIEVVAYFGGEGRKGKRRSITITSDEFFGRNGHPAPITGDAIIHKINQLRTMK